MDIDIPGMILLTEDLYPKLETDQFIDAFERLLGSKRVSGS